jgi:hypothetical protein
MLRAVSAQNYPYPIPPNQQFVGQQPYYPGPVGYSNVNPQQGYVFTPQPNGAGYGEQPAADSAEYDQPPQPLVASSGQQFPPPVYEQSVPIDDEQNQHIQK